MKGLTKKYTRGPTLLSKPCTKGKPKVFCEEMGQANANEKPLHAGDAPPWPTKNQAPALRIPF